MTKKSVPLLFSSMQYYTTNSTFLNDGTGWVDLALDNITTSLKVYTKKIPFVTFDLVKIYKNESKFVLLTFEPNKTAIFEINGQTYERKTNDFGTCELAINLNPGNYLLKLLLII